MSAAPKLKLTTSEYLAIERKASFKSEFFNGEMFAMAGANWSHNLLVSNLHGELFAKLKGKECRVVAQDQRVVIDRTGFYTYPDLVIVCGTPEFSSDDDMSLTNPLVLIEVLSTSTELYDRTVKFRHYQQLPSFREYILVSQSEALCERYHRQEDGIWGLQTVAGFEAFLELKSLPIQLKLQDIYEGITFPEATLR